MPALKTARQWLPLLLTLLVAAGCASPTKDLSEVEQQADREISRIAQWDQESLYETGGIRSGRLMGATAFDASGEAIGDIENVILNEQNQIVALIAEVGGFWDMGDTHVAVPWNEVRMTDDGVELPLRRDNLEQYSLFADRPVTQEDLQETARVEEGLETGPRHWKLTSLLGNYASLEDRPHYGYVDEVIFSEEGTIQAVVVESGGAPYAYPFGGYGEDWRPGYGNYSIPYRDRDVQDRKPFNFNQYDAL